MKNLVGKGGGIIASEKNSEKERAAIVGASRSPAQDRTPQRATVVGLTPKASNSDFVPF